MKRLREQFRGLYWRQMSITVGMVLLTLVLLGTVFFSLSYNYARGQKTDELLERAQVVSRLSVRYLESGRYLTMEELRQDQVFQQLAATAAMISDMDILVCDKEGHVLLSTDETMEGQSITIPEGVMSAVLEQGTWAGRSRLDQLYESKRFVGGVSVVSPTTGNVLGTVFTVSSGDTVDALWRTFAGLLVMKLNNRIVLALDGVIMCLMAWCFGIPYAELQQGIKETVSSMIVAILILLSVGVLVGVWMASGTVPVMIYYGMKVLTPGLFLPVVCILCTLMSTMAGTSWGTLATVGVACMGVAQGLGVPLPAAAGAVCTGAFFGDKISPLSDSPVITATVCEVPLMEGIRHALISTGPAYLISLVFFFLYGLRFAGGTVGGQVYEDILATVSAEFWLSPVLLLPVAVVVALILLKKPTIPTFVAGIAVGAVLAMVFQGESLKDILTVMYSGFSVESGSDVVNSMLNRGGFTSMLSTIGLLIAAGIFGAPLRTAGVVDVLLAFVRRVAKSSRTMSLGVLLLHAVFFTITGAYYVSYPVVGGMVKDLYPEYGLDRKNLMRTLLDTGTGLAPKANATRSEVAQMLMNFDQNVAK